MREKVAPPPQEAARDFNGVSLDYQPTVVSLGADGSCLWPPVRLQKSRLPAAAGETELHSTTQWLGVPSSDAPAALYGPSVVPLATSGLLRSDCGRAWKRLSPASSARGAPGVLFPALLVQGRLLYRRIMFLFRAPSFSNAFFLCHGIDVRGIVGREVLSRLR